MQKYSFYPFAALTIFLCLLSNRVHAESIEKTEKTASTETSKKEPPKEEVIVTEHTLNINGKAVPYKASTGIAQLKDDKGTVKANLFYIAYTRSDVENPSQRPISFCFNGGPGSSSVWLHMGVLGPKRVSLNDEGFS